MVKDIMQKITLQGTKGHLKTIRAHKREVRRLMIAAGLPLQGIRHDWSKYLPSEFWRGARYYQGYRSPNAFERELEGFSRAWLHHKGRNKHHFEYWVDVVACASSMEEASNSQTMRMIGVPMPTRYVVEMFCDRVAASKIYQGNAYTDGSALAYLDREYGASREIMHPDTYRFIKELLTYLNDHGEERTLDYIKHKIVKARYRYAPGVSYS